MAADEPGSGSGDDRVEDAFAREYSSHEEQLKGSQPSPGHLAQVESSLVAAYKKVIEYREVPFVRFGDLDATELAEAFVAYPIIIPMESLLLSSITLFPPSM